MRNRRPMRGPWWSWWGILSPLVPLMLLALVVALFLTQSGATLAHSAFQSPQSPVQTPAASAVPPEVEPGPSEETPLVPPAESPAAPPPEQPGETPAPAMEPGATPVEGIPEVVSTETPAGEEEAPSRFRGLSLAVLIDAAVVALSSLWLCCGGLAVVIFVLLVVASFVLRVT